MKKSEIVQIFLPRIETLCHDVSSTFDTMREQRNVRYLDMLPVGLESTGAAGLTIVFKI